MGDKVGQKRSTGCYDYMSRQESEMYDNALKDGNEQIAELLLRLRDASKEAHANCKY